MMKDDLDDMFKKASNHVRVLMKNLTEDQMLKLYGLYKQSLNGPCNVQKPHFWDLTGKAKWESWNAVSSMPKEKAKNAYIDFVDELDCGWDARIDELESEHTPTGYGVSVSKVLIDDEEPISDQNKTIFDWCKEGNLKQLQLFVDKNAELSCVSDETQMTLLHWAADRGYFNICKYLIESGCNVNSTDEDGQTALHYASACDHEEVVELLVKKGTLLNVKDSDGFYPIDLTNNEKIKEVLSGLS